MSEEEKLQFLENAIVTIFKKNLNRKLNLSDNLSELGLDSLDIVELQMHYEEETGNEIPSGNAIVTIRDLISLMK